ncbi:MAG: SRPBCC family protein [Actinomycetota bacterium]
MRSRVVVRGPASAAAMWAAYADTSRWDSWAPQITSVDPAGPIERGMRGAVYGFFGAKARFEVTALDEAARRWTWKVRAGPVRLTIDHEVGDGEAVVVIDGPAPFVLAYIPVARLALGRLVCISGV